MGAGDAIGYAPPMPLRHFIHIVGFDVPSTTGDGAEPLLVMLDKEPNAQWRAVFQLCVEELPPELTRETPQLRGCEIRVVPSGAVTRKVASDIRAFVERVNRMTFMQGGPQLGGRSEPRL